MFCNLMLCCDMMNPVCDKKEDANCCFGSDLYPYNMGTAIIWHSDSQRLGILAKDQDVIGPSKTVGLQLPRYKIYYHVVAMYEPEVARVSAEQMRC